MRWGAQTAENLFWLELSQPALDCHQFLFLCGKCFVCLLDILVQQILQVLLGLLLIIFGDLVVLLQLLDVVHAVTTDVTHSNLSIFRVLLNLLSQVLTTLLGQLGEYQANHTAIVLRVDAQIADLDGLLEQCHKLRDDLTVILICHSQTQKEDDGYTFTRIKTSGKKLDKLCIESKLTTVLHAEAKDGEYVFRTHANNSTAKTPMGAFEADEVPNDMAAVLKALEEY